MPAQQPQSHPLPSSLSMSLFPLINGLTLVNLHTASHTALHHHLLRQSILATHLRCSLQGGYRKLSVLHLF
jgi:hypothetical protein